MIRNAAKFGYIPEDISRMEANRAYYASLEGVQDKIDSEAARKAEVRAGLRAGMAAEHHAARGVGAASLVVNAAEGNYGAAGIDAAGMAADSRVGAQLAEAAVEGAGSVLGRLSPRLAFNAVVQGGKRLPLLGAGITAGMVLYASGAHAWNGDYDLAAAELAAGGAEAAGNLVGFGAGDAAREAARQGLIAAGGDRFVQVDKSGLRQLGEGAYALGASLLSAPEGRPVAEILPPSHASMAQGADGMGERGDVSRIALERTGLAANDPANSLSLLALEPGRPRGHLLVLEDGSVQGPESGGVAFDSNPQIAAGRNGGTLGILYAGTGAMNDAQWRTVQQVNGWLGVQRQNEGLGGSVEMIAGSTGTAELLSLPTPRGPLPAAGDLQAVMTLPQSRLRASNGMG